MQPNARPSTSPINPVKSEEGDRSTSLAGLQIRVQTLENDARVIRLHRESVTKEKLVSDLWRPGYESVVVVASADAYTVDMASSRGLSANAEESKQLPH